MAYSYLYAMILAFYKLTRKLNKFNTLLLPSLAATPDAALSSASLSVYIPSSSGGLSRFSTGTYAAPPKAAGRGLQALLREFTGPARYPVSFIRSSRARPSPRGQTPLLIESQTIEIKNIQSPSKKPIGIYA